MQMIGSLIPALQRLGFLTFYSYFHDGNLQARDWLSACQQAPSDLKLLVQFFLLGEEISIARLSETLQFDVSGALVAGGVARVNGEFISLGRYRLLSLRSISFFAEVAVDPVTYYGEDSYALAVYARRGPANLAVDLCTGSGIQAMLASFWAAKVIGVEKNPEAVVVARLNVTLNRLDEKVEIIHADAVDFISSVNDGTVDSITCNPPLIPVPPTLKLPFVAGGGLDGLFLTQRIIERGLRSLSGDGSMSFVGSCFCIGSDFVVRQHCCEYAVNQGSAYTLSVLARHPIERGMFLFESICSGLAVHSDCTVEEARNIYIDHSRKVGATELCLFFLSIHKQLGKSLTLDLSNNACRGSWFI